MQFDLTKIRKEKIIKVERLVSTYDSEDPARDRLNLGGDWHMISVTPCSLNSGS